MASHPAPTAQKRDVEKGAAFFDLPVLIEFAPSPSKPRFEFADPSSLGGLDC
jgi:hypothetical protein